MDPDAALQRIRTLLAYLTTELDSGHPDPVEVEGLASELTTYTQGLDDWLSMGGALPSPWATRAAPTPVGPTSSAGDRP